MNHQFNRELQDELYEQFARICKALGSARRFEILELLSQGEHSVEQLARETSMSIANTSQHLQQLKAAKLVRIRKKGVGIYYRLADPTVYHVLESVHSLANSQLAEVDRIFDEYVSLRREVMQLSNEELDQLIHKEDVQILDVRPTNEFESGHISGAVNIPLQQLEALSGTLAKKTKIVVYCRSYYSTLSDQAIEFLQAQGFELLRLENGFSDWKYSGKAIESAPMG
jgi:rhodanese-related sulfurtransferase/DNA-binding transcriptional ArsR family regulator